MAHTCDLGVPVTTDPEDIAAFLRRRGPRVVFATYQSSPQMAAAFTLGRVPAFDLVIADEAHRCAGPVSSDFATVLDAVQDQGPAAAVHDGDAALLHRPGAQEPPRKPNTSTPRWMTKPSSAPCSTGWGSAKPSSAAF